MKLKCSDSLSKLYVLLPVPSNDIDFILLYIIYDGGFSNFEFQFIKICSISSRV